MGEYRTFSQKVFDFNGESGVVYRNDCTSSTGNVPNSFLHRRNNGGSKLHVKHPSLYLTLVFLVGSILFLIDPVLSASLSIVDDKIEGAPKETLEELINNQGYNKSINSIRNCTPPSSDEFPTDLFTKDERQHGAIAIHFFVAFYMLFALLLVCDEYFVPAIDCICNELHVPHNIAGATFMAISTSAPELFTNVIGTFVTKGDLGIGTIVGSAVFNILAVGSCVGIGTNFALKKLPPGETDQSNIRIRRKGIPLDWWSLTRDSGYYLISVGGLIVILVDGKVYWYEALIMLLVYGLYIAGMCYDSTCKAFAEAIVGKFKQAFSASDEHPPTRKISSVLKKVVIENMDSETERTPLISRGSSDSCYASDSALWKDAESNYKTIVRTSKISKGVSAADMIPGEAYDSSSISSIDSTSSNDSTSSSVVVLMAAKDVISFPIKFIQSWTIPDCKKEKNKKWYAVALLSCIAWIGGLSYIISWMVCVIGETFNIPDSVSGLTFLAAGTSFPEVLSSVIVARQGFGSMGLSNSIGSNTFDILGKAQIILLFCLGLPWLIQSLILSAQDVNYIEIHSGGLEYSAVLLITSLVLLYTMIAMNDFSLDFKVGISCVVMYIIFLTFACLLDMNVFFPVNLPPC